MKLTINGTEIEATRGETVLKAAKRAGIDIPHLCSLDWAPSPARLLPPLRGRGGGLPAPAHELHARGHRRHGGAHAHAAGAQGAARDHGTAHREPPAGLPELRARRRLRAGDAGRRAGRAQGTATSAPSSSTRWTSAPRRCGATRTSACSAAAASPSATTCRASARSTSPAGGSRPRWPPASPSASTSASASTAASARGSARRARSWSATRSTTSSRPWPTPTPSWSRQVAPAVPATLLEGHSKSEGVRVMLERLAAALKRVGFDAVFDTSFAADLDRSWKRAPSCSTASRTAACCRCSPAAPRPGSNYVETHRPDLIPHLSTCKSPQQMAGALIREIYPQHTDLGGKRLVVVIVMPCTAKKFEAQDSERRGLRAHHARARPPLGPVRRGLRASSPSRRRSTSRSPRRPAPGGCSPAAAA